MFTSCGRCTGRALAYSVALVAGVASPAAVAAAAESYDLVNCGASTVTTISASQDLTVLSVDIKGIARSNPEKKAFDNSTYLTGPTSWASPAPSGRGAVIVSSWTRTAPSSSARTRWTRPAAEHGSSCRERESGKASRAAASSSR